jgi:hypothetical protein
MFQMKGLVMYELCANDVHQLLFVFRNGQHNFLWGQFGMCLQLMHAARFSHFAFEILISPDSVNIDVGLGANSFSKSSSMSTSRELV